ncbi:MAG: winged helix-turn-helix domain-containing protein, partial [Burkholderiales bacterium]
MTELLITLPGGSLDLLGQRVLRHGEPVKLEPRAWRVLETLARFRHRVVTKEELLAALRPEGTVSESALRQAVRAARLAIGDDGSQPIIRSIPRVGYMFDVPSAPASPSAPAAAGLLRDNIPSLIIGPLRDHTGLPSLRWAAHGLVACIAHGLSVDRRLQVQDAQSLEMSWPQEDARMLQMLRAAGARYAVVGSLTLAGPEFALDLQVHDRDKKVVIPVRAAAPAGLVLAAIQALRHTLLGVGERHGHGLRGCSLLSIELFARAKHCAAMNRHPAALRALELLQHLDPGFPRLDLE